MCLPDDCGIRSAAMTDRPDLAPDDDPDTPGCRDVAVITGVLLVAAIAFVAVGLSLINRDTCEGLCEVAGLTTLYAGGPISGILGVLYGGVHLAWPLDVTVWVIVGFWSARWAGRRGQNPWNVAATLVVVALVFGLVLSRFVELDLPH